MVDIEDVQDLVPYDNLRQKGKFFDYQLVGNDQGLILRRDVHQVVISALSPSLGNFGFNLEAPGTTLDSVVDFAYTNRMEINEENLESLLKIADYFDIQPMKKFIGQYFVINISLENALDYFYKANQYLCSKYSQYIKSFILKKNFLKLNEMTGGFRNLSYHALEYFVKDDQLGLSEEQLFSLIMDWCQKISLERRWLLKHVRYLLMSDDFYNDKVLNARLVLSDEKILNLILQRSKHNAPLSMTKSRIPGESVLSVGGICLSDGPSGIIEVLDNRRRSWHKFKFDFLSKRAYHGMALIGTKIFIFGGFDRNAYQSNYSNDNFAFDVKLKSWTLKSSMLFNRCYLASTVHANLIYAIGGFSGETRLRSVECYNPITNEWKRMPDMVRIRSHAACVTYRNKIYVIGGSDGSTIHDSVEIFDPLTNEWTFGSPLNIQRSGVKAIVYHDKIFVIGGYDGQRRLKSVEILDLNQSYRWKVSTAELNVRRSNFAVTVSDDKILVMGGYDGHGVTSKTEVYDDTSNQWTLYQSMKRPRSALASLTLDDFDLNFAEFIR